MKICTFGSRFFGGQIDRIEAGFVSLGHEIVTDPSAADLVYANNGGYDEVVGLKRAGLIRGKLILNVLDLAPHLGDQFPIARTKIQLGFADAVTCISETVKRDVATRMGLSPTVIYNPIKPITRTRERSFEGYRALFVGRVNDPEKRSSLGAEALAMLGFEASQLVTVGSESPSYGGVYLGPVGDGTLNQLYNSVDFLVCPTRNAFLGLPIIEATAAGVIPIFCRDLDIRTEFFPTDLFPEYAEVEPTPSSIARFVARYMQDNREMDAMKDRLYNHYLHTWQLRMTGRKVAQSILAVYANLP